MELYLYQNGEQVGPYTEEQIAAMVASGSVTKNDNVWREGLADWQPIHTVVDLPSTAPNQTQLAATTQTSDIVSARKRVELPQWVIIAIPPVMTLVLGYFIGREHLKYQMRSAFSDAAAVFAQGFNNTTPTTRSTSSRKVDTTSTSASSQFGETNTLPVSTATPLPQLMLGETHKTEKFAIKLDSAKIETVKVRDMMGSIQTGKSPDLVLSFTFANIDNRRILRFHPSNEFTAGNFRLRDDVDNVIRHVNYGYTSKPVGVLTGSEDIGPDTSVTHIELFSVPPPKTEYLILTINMECLGGDGKIEFKIPASAISK